MEHDDGNKVSCAPLTPNTRAGQTMNAAILRGLGLASGAGGAVYGLPWAAVTSAVQPKRTRVGFGAAAPSRRNGCEALLGASVNTGAGSTCLAVGCCCCLSCSLELSF